MSTWRDLAGRRDGGPDYVFGDIFRAVINGVTAGSRESTNAVVETRRETASKTQHNITIDKRSRQNISSFEIPTSPPPPEPDRVTKIKALDKYHTSLQEGKNKDDKPKYSSEKVGTAFDIPPLKPISLEGACWPDPDPKFPDGNEEVTVQVDNVTRLNAASVDRVCFVRCIEDIQKVLAVARSHGRKVCVRGTKHSMGGQTMNPGAYVIDTTRLNFVKDVNESAMSVTVGPGALWSDLIVELNKNGLSPRTMQSYATFSVGGAMAVNAHGISTDFALVESILSFKVVKWDGSVVQCSRDGDDEEQRELFGLVIGGYGMFGVVAEIVLKIVPNTQMVMEMMTLTADEFLPIYQGVQSADDVEVKLGRIDITSFESFQIFVFRRANANGGRTLSHLPVKPRELSKVSQVLYKWILPVGFSLRTAIEQMNGSAFDFTTDPTERNSLLFESAEPMARLYSPLFEMDDTFVLQEYFLPPSQFRSWIAQAKPILTKSYELVTLLNCTIRYVHEDKETALAYSRHEGGSFAFVLYFRIRRTPEADEQLRGVHQALVRLSLSLGGTFYLPYRPHYTDEEVLQAYPRFRSFFERKAFHDPTNLFCSDWSSRYGGPHMATLPDSSDGDSEPVLRGKEGPLPWPAAVADPDYQIRIVSEFRSNSYRSLMRDPQLKSHFFDVFLKCVLNIENAQTLHGLIAKAVWDVNNRDDADMFDSLTRSLEQAASGPVAALTKAWKLLNQLQDQRKEITRELAAILSRTGRLGKMHDLVTVGDNGKMVLALQQTLRMKGKAYVVNNSNTLTENVMLERGSAGPVGEHVFIDLENPTRIALDSAVADMVTLMGGLHHMPQTSILGFLREVVRVLRPGGLFVLREHDATERLIPLLDMAHSVFNVVTKETLRNERHERRAFRPLLEWRQICEAAGLTDVLVYAMQADDPTMDEMMVFVKGDLQDYHVPEHVSSAPLPPSVAAAAAGSGKKGGMDSMMDNLPNVALELGRSVVEKGIAVLERVESALRDMMEQRSSGQRFAVTQLMHSQLQPLISLLKDLKPYLKAVKLKKGDGSDFIPREVFILLNTLMAKAQAGKASPNELMVVSRIIDAQEYFYTPRKKPKKSPEPEPDGGLGAGGGGGSGVADFGVAAGTGVGAVRREEVLRLVARLLAAYPNLTDVSGLTKCGFSHRAQLLLESTLKGRPVTADSITDALLPFLDPATWKEMSTTLDMLLTDVPGNPFSFEELCNEDTLWWAAMMSFLASPKVRPNTYGLTAASWVGLRPIVKMWELAQKTRNSKSASPASQGVDDYGDASVRLSVLSRDEASVEGKTRAALSAAASLAMETPDATSLDVLVRSLCDVGIIEPTGPSDEFTWFRLPEWMQVEMIRSFGEYLGNEPWFRFPFGDVFSTYLHVLYKECLFVYERSGFTKAYMSWGFVINFVPALAMGLIGMQLQAMAFPCYMALGNEYTSQQLAELVMELVVLAPELSRPNQVTVGARAVGGGAQDYWSQVDPRLIAREHVPGLYTLVAPAMWPFTSIVENLAKQPLLRIVRVSSHEEIQVRVSVANEALADLVASLSGVKVAFRWDNPTVPTDYDGGSGLLKVLNLALCVKVVNLLDCIRVFQVTEGVKLVQVYCFWN